MANVAIAASQAITTTTVTKPSGVVNGSVLVVRYHWFLTTSLTGDPSMSDSFVLIASVNGTDNGTSVRHGVAIFRKVITNAAGEPATYTITPVVGSFPFDGGQIDRLTGADTTTPETSSGTADGGAGSGTLSTGANINSGTEDLLLMGGITEGVSMTTPTSMALDYTQDAGDIAGWSQNPGSVSGATKTSTLGASAHWSTAWVVMKAASTLTVAQELPAWLQAQLEPYGEQFS